MRSEAEPHWYIQADTAQGDSLEEVAGKQRIGLGAEEPGVDPGLPERLPAMPPAMKHLGTPTPAGQLLYVTGYGAPHDGDTM
jgi:hypothetical protein